MILCACALIAALATGACSCDEAQRADHNRAFTDPLTVCVASSLNEAVTQIASDMEPPTDPRAQARTQPRARINAAASGTLKKQIEQGAPCDVFISADPVLMDSLLAQQLVIPDSVCVVARNALVVGVPRRPARASQQQVDRAPPHERALAASADDRNRVTQDAQPTAPDEMPQALLGEEFSRIAIANPDYAPAGRYAKQALEACELWSRGRTKFVIADDAASAANLVMGGFVDAGILFASDLRTRPGIASVHRFAPETHDPIQYVAAIVSDDRGQAGVQPSAGSWLRGLVSASSQDTWRRFGFEPGSQSSGQPDRSSSAPASPGPIAQSPPPLPRVPLSPGAQSRLAPILLSLRVSLVALGFMLLPGLWMALWLARTQSPARIFVEAVLVTPLVIPPVVTGFLLLLVFRAMPVTLQFTWWAAAIASATVSFPLLIRTAKAAIEQIDPRLETVASTLGASRWRVWRTVTLPLAWRGIVGGAVLAWARAFGEFGATIVVAGNMPGTTRTVPLAIWTGVQSANDSAVVPLIVSSVVLSLGAVALSEWLVRRSRNGVSARSA